MFSYVMQLSYKLTCETYPYLVDTPGMIDSTRNDRDYDFKSAIRWFVERSDFVLFFFDPDKPGRCLTLVLLTQLYSRTFQSTGTTGETLQIFTEVLTGIDHKLMILMNKVG